jgi:hypothetical protein
MTALERRCRWLLRAYPAWYRAQRGEEMLATLLEASPPGARWPLPRDARTLIMGGLTVRAWGNQRQSTAASLRLAVLLGAALALLWYCTSNLGANIQALAWRLPPAALQPDIGYRIASSALGLAAVAAVWFASRPVVAAIALASAATWEFSADRILAAHPANLLTQPLGFLIHPVCLLILLVILMPGRRHPPRSWLWLAAAVSAANLLEQMLGVLRLYAVEQAVHTPLTFVPWVILGAVVLWAAVDARPAIAMAIWATSSYLPDLAFRSSPYLIYTWQWYPPAAASAGLAALAIWRLRHQAVL